MILEEYTGEQATILYIIHIYSFTALFIGECTKYINEKLSHLSLIALSHMSYNNLANDGPSDASSHLRQMFSLPLFGLMLLRCKVEMG